MRPLDRAGPARYGLDVPPPAPARSPLRTAARLLRIHQWSKNLLLLVPPLGAHRLDARTLGLAALGVVAFSLCASSGYVLNDVLDVERDRAHAVKRGRPVAAGDVSVAVALTAGAGALGCALALGAALGAGFLGALGVYWMVSMSYSLLLKRVAILDVLVLAGLYTFRILAGTLATGVPTSSWLFTLAIFLFLSLALVKRTSELRALDGAAVAVRGRGYSTGDLEVLSMLGVASGLVAVLVLALYLASADVARLYAHHDRLWLLCPLALYWVSRVWLLARRGLVDEDPVLFALRDRASWAVGALAAVVVAAGS